MPFDPPEITEGLVQRVCERKPRCVCFSRDKRVGLMRNDRIPGAGRFYVSFGSGFLNLFPYDLLPNKKDPFGYEDPLWRFVATEEEYRRIEAWIRDQGDRVFMNDVLYASMALDFNYDFKQERKTEIGALEYRAKYNCDQEATQKLARRTIQLIHNFPAYSEAKLICGVPASENSNDLSARLASSISQELRILDITSKFRLNAEKKKVKDSAVEDKWEIWESAQLEFRGGPLKEKERIILLDDKYQSGISLHYVAMKLQQAGAAHICGLTMVKTMRNKDNIGDGSSNVPEL